MTTDNKIESFTHIEIKSSLYPIFEEWASAHKFEYSPLIPAPEYPLYIGATEPRITRLKHRLSAPPARRIQEELNTLATFFETSVPLSASTRKRLNSAATLIDEMLLSLDATLTETHEKFVKLSNLMDEASEVSITLEDPAMLTRQGQETFDTLNALANALDLCSELTTGNRNIICHHLSECVDALEGMDIDLDYAESTSTTTDEECEQARDEANEARTTIDEAADRFDRAPHLIDDLEDYAAHLRHTSADRKAVGLMELAVSTLKTIRTLLS